MKNIMKKYKSDLILLGIFVGGLLTLISLAILPQLKLIGTDEPFNNTAINIGPGVQWYALFIVFGLIMGAVFATVEFKRLGWKPDDLLDGLIIIAPLAIIGTRVYYLLFDEHTRTVGEFFQTFFQFRDGGLAIHGAIIVSTIAVIIFSRYKKLNVFIVFDVLAIGLLIGQISGRWGNFMNAEAHGHETTSSFLNGILPGFIKHQMQFDGISILDQGIYHPTFLYESFWNFIGLITLLVLRRIKVLKAGDILGIYLIWYGLGRSYLENFYRTDQLKVIFNFLPVNVLLSIVLLAGGGILLIILKRVFLKDLDYYVNYLQVELNYPWEKINEQD